MAADGTIVVQISGDASEIEKELKNLGNSSKQATDKIVNDIAGISEAFQEPIKTVKEVQSEIGKLTHVYMKEGLNQSEASKKAWAELRSEYDKAKQAAKELGDETGKTGTEMDKAQQAAKKLGDEVDGAGEKMNDAGQKALSFGDILKANLASDAIMSGVKGLSSAVFDLAKDLGTSLIDMAKDGVEYNAQMETYTTSFTTMLGSQSEALKLVAALKEKAAATPFGLEDLAKAQQTLMSFGVSVDDATTYMNQLGDISQGNKDRFQSLSLAMAQISSTGKLMGQDLLQMVNAG